MIRIRRITSIDVLAKTIPKPKGAIPNFGLPKWKVMPLEHKIPMISAPKDAYNFTRHKLGRKLWATGSRMDFDLSDPYCHETKFSYDSLHDEHLLEFFAKPNNIKHLLKADLITDNMDVKCSLHDYNIYRKYLSKVHADRIKRELRKRSRLFVEKRILYYAEDQARKKAKKLKKEEQLASARQYIIQQKILQEELKRRRQQEKVHKATQRLKLLKFIQQKERKLTNVNRMIRTEQKRKIATDIARHKAIDILRERKRKEKVRMKTKNTQLMNIEQQKRKTIEEKWKRKQCFQEKDIVKQKTLMQHINIRRQQFITDYNYKINKETARMQRLFENAKLFTNCYIKRHLPDGRKRICCRKYFQQNMLIKNDKVKQKIKQKLKSAHTKLERKRIARTNDKNKTEKRVKQQDSLTGNETKCQSTVI